MKCCLILLSCVNIFYLTRCYVLSGEDEVIVTVQEGQLQGTVDTLYDGSSYYSFKGIPYAQPPLGQLRFQAPQPPQPWEGVLNATEHRDICTQINLAGSSAAVGSEDCLYLNVYSKSLEPSSNLPVMVYIHGGSYLVGSGNEVMYGPKFLLQHDVVLVTINYRLDLLGFLCLDTPEVPGNAGMKDQVAAMKWVKENIGIFGGDPDNITLFGESSGASSVTYHMLSPMSLGLFNKAIAQSGTCISDWAQGNDSVERAFRVGKYLGKDTNDTTELFDFFKGLPAEKLVNVTVLSLTPDEEYRGLQIHFAIVSEKEFENVDAFLSEEPMDILLSNEISSIPLLLGYNSAEGIFFARDRVTKLEIYNETPSFDVPRQIANRVTEDELKEMGEEIKEFYVDNEDYTIDNLQDSIDLLSDVYFVYDTHRFAYLYSKYNNPIYMYKFEITSDLNIWSIRANMSGLDLKGVSHLDELFYIFSANQTKDQYESQDQIRDYVWKVTKMWTDFAKTSNPTPDWSLGVTWPEYTVANKEYLDIDSQLTVGNYADQERVEFWNELYSEAGLPSISDEVEQNDEVIVTVQEGQLQGTVDTLYDGSPYYSFKGIPYAQPPVGQLRFLAPQPPQPWEGVLNATEHRDICTQINLAGSSAAVGSEDCLYLNVYSKSLEPSSNLPVMVYIHGGSYLVGSGNEVMYGPKFLLQHDVVLVTINYRLDLLGFLCLDTPEVPGNAGMKDQVAAMKWVKENIGIFGGDPDNITLFGESSGASSVTYHMLSPMSLGLFNKAIAQSGTCISDWAQGNDSVERAFRVGKYLGKDTNDTTELFDFFKGLPAEKLVNVTVLSLTPDEEYRGLQIHFAIVSEKEFENVDAFLSEEPMDILLSNGISSKPLLLGYNSAEGIFFARDRVTKLEIYNETPSFDVPRQIANRVTEDELKEMGEEIKEFYVDNEDYTIDNLQDSIDLLSDVYFVYDTHRFAYLYSKYNNPIYMYKFEITSDLNIWSIRANMSGLDLKGVSHLDELFYIFSANQTKDQYESQDQIRDYVWKVTKMWTDFAKTSNPTPDWSLGVTWPEYTVANKEYLDIDSQLTVGNYADQERVEFWNELYSEAGLPSISDEVGQNDEVIVTVQEGLLQGTVDTLYDGSPYYSFKGIPYAQPPVGQLRFLAPQPPQPWEGVLNATEHRDICTQINLAGSSAAVGSEDCLYLNVYSKSLEPSSNLPVMVYIHGGSYLVGSGNEVMYGPKFLLQHDVVLVTINYRLDLLGFLCLDTPEVPGNAGMKDQVAAMKWVKENIGIFGGDPDNITLFGESSGASSVTYHMLSPMSLGLFNKAIAQSGTCISDWAQGNDSVERAFRVGKYLGKDTNDTTELFDFFKGLPAEKLVNVTVLSLTPDEEYRGLQIHFAIVSEKEFENVDAFLSEEPMDILLSNGISSIPLLLGYNSAEGIFFARDRVTKLEIYNETPSFDVPRQIANRVTEDELKEMGEEIKEFYVDNEDYTIDNLQDSIDLLSDVYFVYDTHRFAYLYSKYNNPIYMYKFEITSDLNIWSIRANMSGLDLKGVSHLDELFYIFSANQTKDQYESQDQIRDYVWKVTKMWTDFAKTSNPTPDWSLGVTWPEYTVANKEYLDIDSQLTVGNYADQERVEFWNELYSEAGLPSISDEVEQNDEVIVTVQEGQLQGTVDTLYDGSPYYSFKGIPYAQPPVGQLRFLAPQPPQPWEGVLNATEHRDICTQINLAGSSAAVGSEDCLYLNVYSKSLEPSSNLPVMVYIHGGSYLVGSGNDVMYGPKFLLQHDVVLVTINYRLDLLGFLCLDTPEVPGNAGMKDQVAAMKWVKENIGIFGGDPDNITLFGESSGASSVTYHMLSPMSLGLFNKAIAQSGTCISDWAQGNDSVERAFRVGKYLGKDTNDTTELFDFFKGLPAEKLVNVTVLSLTPDEEYRGLQIHFAIVSEKEFENVDAFLSEEPMDILLSNEISSIPLLLGYNSAEGIFFARDRVTKLEIYNEIPSFDVPRQIANRVTEDELEEMGEEIKEFYVDNEDYTIDNLQDSIDLLSDVYFVYDTHRFAYLYSKYNNPIYMYKFEITSDLNIWSIRANMSGLDLKGVSHLDELFYIFSANQTKDQYESQDQIRDYVWEVTKMWTDFAKTSNPTPDWSLGVTWPQYTVANKEYLDIDSQLTVGNYADQERVEFWNELYSEAGLPSISDEVGQNVID